MPIPLNLTLAELGTLKVFAANGVESARILVDAIDGQPTRGVVLADLRRAYMAVRADGGSDMVPGLEEYPHVRTKVADGFHAAGCYRLGRVQAKRPAPGMDRGAMKKVTLTNQNQATIETLAVRSFPEAMEPGGTGVVHLHDVGHTRYLYYQNQRVCDAEAARPRRDQGGD